MSVFGRLGYSFNDPASSSVQTFSQNVSNRMAMVPPLLKKWQMQDLGSSNVSNYFQNPVANVIQSIWNTANSYITYNSQNIQNTDPTINTSISSAIANAVLIATSYANTYLYISNRQSNVVAAGNDTINIHYTTAMSTSKTLMYIVNQTDGIQNNATIMGNFTSIMIGNTLNSLFLTFSNLTSIFANTINTSSSPASSNISLVNAQALQNNLATLASTMYSFPQNDNNFFKNSKAVLADFNSLKQVSNLGQSETYLMKNFIGTPNLVSKLNQS